MEHEFVARFAQAWRRPTPERLVALRHPDVVLHQPYAPAIRGREAARREFHRLLRWLPGLRGEVRRSCGATDVVFIEWRMHVPIGRGIVLGVVDRFVLREGLGIDRAAYFDPRPLVVALLTHPRLWRGSVRYRLGRR